MNWSNWTKILGQKAEGIGRGDIVYFRRGNVPELGKVVGDGNPIRVPLMRCGPDGRVSTRRTYWRNRSQLYVQVISERQ